MNKNNILIFVTAGYWQIKGIKEAKKLGLKTLGIDENSKADGLKICDFKIVEDINNHNLIKNKIENLKLSPIGCISYCSEAGLKLSAFLIDEYKLYGTDKKTTKLLTNKYLQRKKLSPYISQPKFYSSKSIEKIKKYILKSNKPLIIKPVDGSGSRGVIKINKIKKTIDYMLNKCLTFSNEKQIIVEEFIKGKELTVEMFFINGNPIYLAITSKKKLANTKNTVAYELATTELLKDDEQKIFKFVNSAYKKIGYKNGPAHAEIIKQHQKYFIVELAGRGAGFDVFDKFLPKITNINLPKLLILQSINKIDDLKYKLERKKGIIRYYPSKKGKIKRIMFNYNYKDKDVFFKKFVKKDQFTNSPVSDADRNGYLMVIDKEYKNCRKKIINNYKKLKFIY